MSKELINVGVANMDSMSVEIEILKKWDVKNMMYIGDTVFFSVDGSYFSMKTKDFKRIYNK